MAYFESSRVIADAIAVADRRSEWVAKQVVVLVCSKALSAGLCRVLLGLDGGFLYASESRIEARNLARNLARPRNLFQIPNPYRDLFITNPVRF